MEARAGPPAMWRARSATRPVSCLISKSTVTEITDITDPLRQDNHACITRDLSGI
jgi:hypothetical protein